MMIKKVLGIRIKFRGVYSSTFAPHVGGGKFFKNFELGKVFKIHVRGKEGEKGKKWGKGKKGRREKEGKFPSPLEKLPISHAIPF